MAQDARRVPQVTLDRADPVEVHRPPRVRNDHGIVVDVGPTCACGSSSRATWWTLPGVGTRPDVDELPDARVFGEEPDGAAHKAPVGPGRCPGLGHRGQQLTVVARSSV